jgi:amino acid adenylation domain-containing protein
MQAAQTELIVTTEVLGDQLFADMHVVLIDRDWTRIEQESHAAVSVTIKENDLAYVMFTSGSTGGAKAVGLEHRNAVAFMHWAKLQFAPEELSGVFASTSICFDLSVFELFAPLSWGGTIVLADNPMQLATHAAREHVRLVNTVPSAVPELLKAGIPRNVTTVNLAGEALAQTLVDQLYEAGVQRVYDLYGPTENTTYSTCALRTKGGRATIGRPLANTEAYIVDAKLQPVPIGVPGELMVGGALLTRGYLHQPELTRQKFIPHPFRKEPGARVYRTGDLTRFLSNGDIEFLGRIDHQIKIRGYRIEPGDIEAEIQKHPAVEECVAVLREDTPGQKQIAAYIASRSGEETSAHEMRNFLRERLPAYMIPATFTFLEKLPLTPNGKLDRRALPAPDHGHVEKESAATEEEPLSEVEQALAQIWREVIGVESVGRHDNFFDLGGHSILITQIVSRCRNTMGVELSLRNFFEAPTVGELAPMIEQQLLEQLEQIPEAEAQRLASQLEPVSKGAS